jgi:hypothetical protein
MEEDLLDGRECLWVLSVDWSRRGHQNSRDREIRGAPTGRVIPNSILRNSNYEILEVDHSRSGSFGQQLIRGSSVNTVSHNRDNPPSSEGNEFWRQNHLLFQGEII